MVNTEHGPDLAYRHFVVGPLSQYPARNIQILIEILIECLGKANDSKAASDGNYASFS